MNDVEKKIKELEDIEKIKKLKARYCYLVDEMVAGNKAKLNELMTYFTDDPWIDFSEFGRHEGKEAAATFMGGIVAQILSYTAHMVSNPIIELNGNKATGRWYVEVPCTLRATNTPMWLQGKYDEEYRKVGEDWKWASIATRFDFFSPLEEGWVKARMPKIS